MRVTLETCKERGVGSPGCLQGVSRVSLNHTCLERATLLILKVMPKATPEM